MIAKTEMNIKTDMKGKIMKAARITAKAISLILMPIMVLMCCSVCFATSEEKITSVSDAEEPNYGESSQAAFIQAEVVSVPLKNLITFKNGVAENPDGIVLKLYYDDNTSSEVTVEKRGNSYYADNVEIHIRDWNLAVVLYGKLTETIIFKNGVMAQYDFYSARTHLLKPIVNVFGNINVKVR